MSSHDHALPGATEFRAMFFRLLGPEQRFYKLVVIYSLALSLLTLAIPISVQTLIDTIANIGLVRAIVVISLLLFGLLLFSGILYAFRAYIMELFNRRIFIRIASEMALGAVAAQESGTDERKRLALFNRFFDIMTLKKNVPNIITNGFSLILQAIIGFIVVSLYHLYFFLFAMVLVFLLLIVWKMWGWKAIQTGFLLSEAKYETADWLQTLSISLRDFKATGNIEYILEEFNDVVNHHVDEQEKHFAYTYKQLLSFLFINALASAAFLGMGGWLVIQGELTLGQLVAAELIMMAIFAGLPQLAGYLGYFYDICAAVEEISRFEQLP
ncbi:MAG: ABC transporter transmembrane domain-containing protein [Gammaproteobacteria bacterium]|nr:ABC transporter transmembrane domain-containing protein [Gammaproteobacteria bacterium]